MITFKEFQYKSNLILERYYGPNEKRPSGTTPLQAAKKKGITGEKLHKVERGADNPEVDTRPQEGVKVSKRYDTVTISHPESGIEYDVEHKGHINGKPHHSINWWNTAGTAKTPKEKLELARKSKHIWFKHVQHTLPHGSTVSNDPATEKHKKIYGKQGLDTVSPTGKRTVERQYGKVGRMPSPKQQAKGKKSRLSPYSLSSNQ
jgi:hypothetical protein